MAPEQLTAPDAAQASADLFSLSVMFYELLVGVVPQNYWQPPSGGRADVSIAIDQLIQKGLSPSPRARFQTVSEYRDALEAATKQRAASAGNTGTWTDRPEVQDAIKKTTDFLNKGGLIGQLVDKGKAAAPQAVSGAGPAPPHGEKNLWGWFMYAVTKRYADGKGRAHRKEYWGFNLGAFALMFAAAMIDSAGAGSGGGFDIYGNYYEGEATLIASSIVWLVLVAPSVGLASRRMHDLGYSGWLAAVVAIPVVGSVIAILMGLPRGAPGENQYGPDPLAPAGGGS
jgi:uncharacterized membrane protein YhaH (DUF805 family)